MAEISKQTLWDIQKEAKKYLVSVKDKNITDADIIHAENLMVFGYHQALEELAIEQKERRANKENMAIINSEWA